MSEAERYTVVENSRLDLTHLNRAMITSEITILNNTSIAVAVIHASGEIQTLPMRSSFEAGIVAREVVILVKSGRRNMMDAETKKPIPLNIQEIRIGQGELTKEPVFIKSLNILVTREDCASLQQHPARSMTHSEAATKTIEDFRYAVDKSVHITLTANDPNGDLKEIFTILNGKVIPIPVQNNYDTSVVPELICTVQVDEDVTVLSAGIGELLDSEDYILDLTKCLVPFVTTSEDSAKEAIERYTTYTAKEIDEKIATLTSEYDDKYAELKKVYNDKRLVLESQIERLKEIVSDRDHSINVLNAKYDSLSGAVMHGDISQERKLKQETLQNTKAISDNNVDISSTKAHTARTESDAKFWQIIAVAAVPVVAALIGFLIKKGSSD